DIARELQDFGRVDIDVDQTIVCVVGDFDQEGHGYVARVLDAVKHLPVRMVSYGGSDHNITLLVRTSDKVETLRSLHNQLFWHLISLKCLMLRLFSRIQTRI